jgi:hypothetical protein
MKRTFTKKSWTFLISIFAIGGIVIACADGDWPEYGSSNFTPEAFVEKRYSPFFYSPYLYYYGIGHDNSQSERFNEKNVSDWAGYLGNITSSAELNYLLNEPGKATVDSIALYLDGKYGSLPGEVAAYQLFREKNNKKVKDFISYLSLAKEAAVFANNTSAWWDYEPKKQVVYAGAAALNKALQSGFTNAGDKFLKQRYWFQLVRSYFFNGAPEKAAAFFETNESKFEKNILYYRTMAYCAGAYYRQKNYGKANYYYSLVYDSCDEMKTSAHFSFHPQEESDWQATLALCKNNKEKITLWQMLGVFYGDEKRSIREIQVLDPASNKADLLLARAINKEEQKMNSEYDVFNPAKMSAITIDKDLLALVSGIANAGNNSNPFMWSAAAGYLQLLDHNYKQADRYFAQAEKTVSGEKLKQWQLRLLKALNKVAGAAKVDDQFEKEILDDVEWLRTYNSGEGDPFRYTNAFAFIKATMAKKYSKQLQLVKSECYVTKQAFYTDDKNVEAMKTFLQKNDMTPYEKLCRNLYNKNLDDLYDYQGVRLAYDDKMEPAIAAMEKAGEKGNFNFQGNPFNGRINDCHECDHASYKGTPYTKLGLLKKMKEMEANVQAGNDVYNNTLLLGNAFYNLSYYGNARDFYLSSIPGSFQLTSNTLDSTFKDFLLSMKAAAGYYQKALAAAATKEQKAKCYYMLAKCERNSWYTKNIFNGSDYYSGSDMVDLKAINSFNMLKQYSDTKYYQEVIKECGYFRAFLKSY